MRQIILDRHLVYFGSLGSIAPRDFASSDYRQGWRNMMKGGWYLGESIRISGKDYSHKGSGASLRTEKKRLDGNI